MTPKDQAAMQQALEALDLMPPNRDTPKSVWELRSEAITALREALAESNMNPNCKSVQARLATSRWYVRAKQAEQIPQKERKDFIDGYDAGMADAKRMQQAEQSQLADATLEPVGWTAASNLVDDGYGHSFSVVSSEPANTTSEPYVPLYAAPLAKQVTPVTQAVRTKDLTDDEIYTLYSEPCSDREMVEFAREAIAADREKNK